MKELEGREYFPDCRFNNSDLSEHYKKTEKFGYFTENGAAYVINRRDTPRQWLQYLCNDKVRSTVSNTGKGFLWHSKYGFITKHWEQNYLVRNVNGARCLYFKIGGAEKEFFSQSANFYETVRPGYVEFYGEIEKLVIKVRIFVPTDLPCECWNISIINTDKRTVSCEVRVSVEWMDWSRPLSINAADKNSYIKKNSDEIGTIFIADKAAAKKADTTEENGAYENKVFISTVQIINKYDIDAGADAVLRIASGAFEEKCERDGIISLFEHDLFEEKFNETVSETAKLIKRNLVELPDKNTEYFLNYWLKNQLFLTYRYDRGSQMDGYRDALQDSWGYCLIDPYKAKEKILRTLSYMYEDGRCPRQYNRYNGAVDDRDFSDSPIWAANALDSYIKETGDTGVLDEVIGFYGSEKKAAVKEHILRALDYLYNSRGKNGLILIRAGDWADGLGGINKYGSDATGVWITIAAFNAQNIMGDIFDYIGDKENATLMKARSDEYKKVVNEVGWDGNWYTYAFFADGEPIGSAQNYEGKIWLNPQTWAIFSGIVDSKDKVEKITRSINRYLQTPFGALVCYPPYVYHGEKCGRVERQIPGTFLNAAIYNHAAAFKIYSDIARGDSEEAYDSFVRAIPNHPDNSDTRRTSEPYAIGNVYYGPDSERYGMNLFSWFTATAAWLIHAGYEEILGVKADFDGIVINPHVPEMWDGFKVTKCYRDTQYNITFIKTEGKNSITADGNPIKGNKVYSKERYCNITVRYGGDRDE